MADRREEWLERTGIDGFNLMPCPPSRGLADRCDLLIPELQHRGLARKAYEPMEPTLREQIATAFRELLMNAVEHGGHLDPEKTVDLSYIRTARSIVYYIRDPGAGFSMDTLAPAAIAAFTIART